VRVDVLAPTNKNTLTATRATLHLSAQSPKSLWRVNDDNKRQLQPEPCQAKQLLSTIVQKAPHQQVLEANQGDQQKELVVKSLVPPNCRELWEFLNQANHYHHFVKDYAAVVKPLTALTSPKVKWAWNDAQQQAFKDIKQKVGASPIFSDPVKGKPFHLCPDASDYAVRAAFRTEGEGWSVPSCGIWTTVHLMNHWQHLLLGAQFEVLTDHQALSKMFGQAESSTGKLARWVSKMQPFKPFNVVSAQQ